MELRFSSVGRGGETRQALDETHRGELEPRVAQAMASVARALIAAISAGEFEERLHSLEQQAPRREPAR